MESMVVGLEEFGEGETSATVWPLGEEAGGITAQVAGASLKPKRI